MALPAALSLPATPVMLGANADAKQEYFDALQRTLDALDARANRGPNWFQLAGALLDPGRTGNVGEALGRASTILGEQQQRQADMQIPIAQARAQLAGQKYETENQAKAISLLAQTLGTTPDKVETRLASGNISPPELNRLAQIFPTIAQLSPKVGEIVKGVFGMQKDIGAATLARQQFELDSDKFAAEQRQRLIANAAADRTAGMSQAELIAKWGTDVLALLPGGGMPITGPRPGGTPTPAAGPTPATGTMPTPAAGPTPATGTMPAPATGTMPAPATGPAAVPMPATGPAAVPTPAGMPAAGPTPAAAAVPTPAAGPAAGPTPAAAAVPTPAAGILGAPAGQGAALFAQNPNAGELYKQYSEYAKTALSVDPTSREGQVATLRMLETANQLHGMGVPVPRDPSTIRELLSRQGQQAAPVAVPAAPVSPVSPAAPTLPASQVTASSDLQALPLAARADAAKRRLEESDKPFNEKRTEILTYTPQLLEGSNTNLRQLDRIAREKPQIFALMQQQGLLSGLMTLAQEGAQLTAGTFNARLGLPVQQFLEKTKLPPQDQQAVRDVARILGAEFLSNVRANKGLLGINPTDNDARLLQAPMVNVQDSAKAVQLWSRQQILLNKQREALYGAMSEYSDKTGATASPRQFFAPGSVYEKINKDYARFRMQLYNQFYPTR